MPGSLAKGNQYGQTFTEAAVTATPVLGKRFVQYAADGSGGGIVVSPTVGGAPVLGVALHDAGTTASPTLQATIQRGGRRVMEAGAAFTAPQRVMNANVGRAVAYGRA